MDVQRPVLPAELLAPHAVHDGVAGHGHALVLQQQAEQLKLLVRQGDFFAVHLDHVALGADEQRTELVVAVFLPALRPAQDGPDAGHQLHHAEGLGDEIVCAAVQAHDPVILRVLGREHDDGQLLRPRRRPELLQDGQAVLLREHDVQQDQIGLGLAHGLPKLRRALEALGLVALAVQGVDDQLADAVVVFQ